MDAPAKDDAEDIVCATVFCRHSNLQWTYFSNYYKWMVCCTEYSRRWPVLQLPVSQRRCLHRRIPGLLMRLCGRISWQELSDRNRWHPTYVQ